LHLLPKLQENLYEKVLVTKILIIFLLVFSSLLYLSLFLSSFPFSSCHGKNQSEEKGRKDRQIKRNVFQVSGFFQLSFH